MPSIRIVAIATALCAAPALAGGPSGNFNLTRRFSFFVDGKEVKVTRIEGVDHKSDSVQFQDDDATSRNRPQPTSPAEVTVRYSSVDRDPLLDWLRLVAGGKSSLKTLSINYIPDAGSETAHLNILKAWPVRCSWSKPKAPSRTAGKGQNP